MDLAAPIRRRLLAEAFGTFWIVFAGTGAVIVGDLTGAIPHVGIAAVFGITVFAMIASVGDVSGAHFNPAVTVGFYLAKRVPGHTVAPYVVSQLVGALVASAALAVLFPDHRTLGATLPSSALMQSWVLELLLTCGLMFVILSVTNGARERGITAGLAIGGAVALGALFGGPISGASMNPARSLAPALVSGQSEFLWLYMTAPVVGAAMAVLLCRGTRGAACCGGMATERCG